MPYKERGLEFVTFFQMHIEDKVYKYFTMCHIKHHDNLKKGGMEEQLHAFIILALDGGE
jgi:hypothetical protein